MITTTQLTKVYDLDGVTTIALDHVTFTVERGEFIAVMGPSGSGKSTLMHILGALDTPTSGTYLLDGKNVGTMNDDQLAEIRNRRIGFVFQAYNLLPRTTALKNVILPMAYARFPRAKRFQHAKELLHLVGLSDRMDHTSSQLSGGQQQRVAIARALALDPAIILADEPTGNLATAQSEEVMGIFAGLHRQGHTIVMITHEPSVAVYAKRVLTLRDGKIVEDKRQ
ncbi:MAG: ABC transporter ATP-binding protein [bacterium]